MVITFLPRSKCLLISWLQSPSAVILEPKKIKSHYFHCFSIYLPWSDGTICHDLCFWLLSFKPAFSLSSFTFIERLFSPLCFLPLGRHHLHIWGCYFSQQSWFQLVIHPAWHFRWCTLHISKGNRVCTCCHFDTCFLFDISVVFCYFLLLVTSLIVWFSLVLYLYLFLFVFCASFVGFLVTMRLIYISICIYNHTCSKLIVI